jgi:hypothetical protein
MLSQAVLQAMLLKLPKSFRQHTLPFGQSLSPSQNAVMTPKAAGSQLLANTSGVPVLGGNSRTQQALAEISRLMSPQLTIGARQEPEPSQRRLSVQGPAP